ncbi:MAG: hypothetical protein KTR31_04315 [Myxococcales bacterium]|nr:hypothetical protein [Myxococcales bacterium]
MRVTVCVMMMGAVGCENTESWVYAPEGEASIVLEEATEMSGQAILRYASDGMPRPDEVVSNALRLSATSEPTDDWVMRFPHADPADLIEVAEPGALNLDGAYVPCDGGTCEVVVPFGVERLGTKRTRLEVAGDAILTIGTLFRDLGPLDDRASLQIVFDE